MDFFLFILQSTAIALIDVLEIAFFLRAVLSWLPLDENAISEVLYRITEPFILPIRSLLHKMNLFQGMPIDMSFLFTVLILALLRAVLGAF